MTKYINDPLSNHDLHKFIKQWDSKGANIFSDEDLTPNTPLETIFSGRGHAIIFHRYPNQPVGHWYTILRDPQKNIYFLDSFAENPEFYSKHMLPCLKNNGVKSVTVNKTPMQHSESSICGRYGVLFTCLHKLNTSIDNIYKFMDEGKKKYGSYDKFVLKMTT